VSVEDTRLDIIKEISKSESKMMRYSLFKILPGEALVIIEEYLVPEDSIDSTKIP